MFEPESFFKSVFSLHSMDKESAIWQFTSMYVKPAAVCRMITTHKHAKGRWSRDDPAFLLIEVGVLAAISLIWSILPMTPFSLGTIIRALSTFIIFDFFIIGGVLATIVWFCLNKWGKTKLTAHHIDEDIEWRYCFDVYCNSFIAIIVDINIGFVMVSILGMISNHWFFRVFLPDLVLLIGVVHFVVLAVPLILVIPYVNKFSIVPVVVPLLVMFLVAILFGFEGGNRWMHFHFAK